MHTYAVTNDKASACINLKTKISPSRTMKILIIDDNRDFANMLGSFLKHLDYKAYTAYDEAQAMEKILTIIPDLIFCDIGLPNKGGYRIAKKIKSECSLKHIYVVALTCFVQEKYERIALEHGFDSYVSKPIQSSQLQDIFSQTEIRKGNRDHCMSLVSAV